MTRPQLYIFQYQKIFMGDVKKARRKKMFSPKSVTKLEDLTVFISLHVKGNEYFLRTKSQKCKKPLNILKKKVFINRSQIFIALSKSLPHIEIMKFCQNHWSLMDTFRTFDSGKHAWSPLIRRRGSLSLTLKEKYIVVCHYAEKYSCFSGGCHMPHVCHL